MTRDSRPYDDLETFLSTYHVSPRLDMLDWREVLVCIISQRGDAELFRRLMAALCEDDASEGVPVQAFARLLESSGHGG